MSISLLIAILVAIFVATAVLLWFGGQWVSKILRRQSARSYALQKLSRTGLMVYAAMAIVLAVVATVRDLRPESQVGRFLNTWDGLAIAFLVCIAVFWIVGGVLERCGYPFFKPEEDRAV